MFSYCSARVSTVMLTHKLPKNISNLCSCCQRLTRTKIGDEFRCAHCTHVMDRDHDAALNILGRGIVTPVTAAAKLPKSQNLV